MKQQKMIDELMYRIDRYRSMGNGAMAQALSKQLRELNAQVKWNSLEDTNSDAQQSVFLLRNVQRLHLLFPSPSSQFGEVVSTGSNFIHLLSQQTVAHNTDDEKAF